VKDPQPSRTRRLPGDNPLYHPVKCRCPALPSGPCQETSSGCPRPSPRPRRARVRHCWRPSCWAGYGRSCRRSAAGCSGLQAGAPFFLDVAVAPDDQGGQPGEQEQGDDDEPGRVEVEAGQHAPQAAGLAEPAELIWEQVRVSIPPVNRQMATDSPRGCWRGGVAGNPALVKP